MSHYEIRKASTNEVVVIVSSSMSSSPDYRAKESFARMEKAAGKGKYILVEVK